jgi:hypothetical protein
VKYCITEAKADFLKKMSFKKNLKSKLLKLKLIKKEKL